VALAKQARHGMRPGKRARGVDRSWQGPFVPPEDWYEPSEETANCYRVITQPPGEGFRHLLTEEDVRRRLAKLPQRFVRPLEVVQLSRMTRKKQSFPCYGMQWGCTIYLYPIEASLTEYCDCPPRPQQQIEARMFGRQWVQESPDLWVLEWTEESLRDFYFNNVLIHELGHLLDDRNTNYDERERFAEWFAIEHGYKPSRRRLARQAVKKVVRRHHAT